MRIAVGSDHAGYEDPPPYYKPAIEDYVRKLGHEVVDCGTYGPGAVDYPDIGDNVAKAIASGEAEMGIMVCGTGIGISIAANRNPAVRAAVCVDEQMVLAARKHNNANVLSLGRRVLSLDEALALVDLFLSTEFSTEERHHRRVAKMG